MIKLANVFVVLATAILLTACESFTEIQAQAEVAAVALEKDIGAKPFVAWNSRNGSLTQVNFVFDGAKLNQYTIGDLERRVNQIVATSFKSKPAQVMVSVRWKG
jgi:hypothetical protein